MKKFRLNPYSDCEITDILSEIDEFSVHHSQNHVCIATDNYFFKVTKVSLREFKYNNHNEEIVYFAATKSNRPSSRYNLVYLCSSQFPIKDKTKVAIMDSNMQASYLISLILKIYENEGYII